MEQADISEAELETPGKQDSQYQVLSTKLSLTVGRLQTRRTAKSYRNRLRHPIHHFFERIKSSCAGKGGMHKWPAVSGSAQLHVLFACVRKQVEFVHTCYEHRPLEGIGCLTAQQISRLERHHMLAARPQGIDSVSQGQAAYPLFSVPPKPHS